MIEQIKQKIEILEKEIEEITNNCYREEHFKSKQQVLNWESEIPLCVDCNIRIIFKQDKLSTFKETVLMMADEEIKWLERYNKLLICSNEFNVCRDSVDEMKEWSFYKTRIEELQQIKELCEETK
jgi:hypothetical protein